MKVLDRLGLGARKARLGLGLYRKARKATERLGARKTRPGLGLRRLELEAL